MVDGVRVVVPGSLDLITPYVLLEQQDWFEDEIKFLRHLLKPGQKVIDIGANYGVYTLSMARTVGPTGHVWAFEPTSSTARLLAEGITANGFTQVTLERSALSNKTGTAQLSLHKQSELNALVHGVSDVGASETVPLVTMDACLETCGWQDIELVKIDAEGEEANILKGGARFFSEQSPLVLYEVRIGKDMHMEFVQDFATLGYNSYRLIPGLNLLASFTADSLQDDFQINLFCCKPDRAARLAALGFLVETPAGSSRIREGRISGSMEKCGGQNTHGWRNVLVRLPYGAQLAGLWEQTVAGGNSQTVEEALSLHALSQDSSLSAGERFDALKASFDRFRTICESAPSYLRLASLARVARAYGARMIAVNALEQLSDKIVQRGYADPSEPFLAPGERYDSLPLGDTPEHWILSATLEELERIDSFSSIYTGDSSRERLKIINALGYGSAEMWRRLNLLEQRFGRSSRPVDD